MSNKIATLVAGVEGSIATVKLWKLDPPLMGKAFVFSAFLDGAPYAVLVPAETQDENCRTMDRTMLPLQVPSDFATDEAALLGRFDYTIAANA